MRGFNDGGWTVVKLKQVVTGPITCASKIRQSLRTGDKYDQYQRVFYFYCSLRLFA
jgi:hypothetical protein